MAEYAQTFRLYIDKMGGKSGGVRLYGVTHRHRNGDGKKKAANEYVETEMQKIAELIKFQGRVSYYVFDWTHNDYVEFRRVGQDNPCEIYYRAEGTGDALKNYKIERFNPAKIRHQTFKPGVTQTVPLYAGGGDERVPIAMGVQEGVQQLQRLKESSWNTFSYPDR